MQSPWYCVSRTVEMASKITTKEAPVVVKADASSIVMAIGRRGSRFTSHRNGERNTSHRNQVDKVSAKVAIPEGTKQTIRLRLTH